MNNVIRVAEVAQQTRENVRSAIRLPLYVRLGFFVFAVIAVLVAGWLLHLRLYVQPAYQLESYEAILPGQRWKARTGLEYSCRGEHNLSAERKYCTHAPVDGPFSLIDVIVWNGVVRRTGFALAEDQLMVGDLASLWGEPIVHLYGASVNFEWPDQNATARGRAANGRFSYFIPLHHVSLGSQLGT